MAWLFWTVVMGVVELTAVHPAARRARCVPFAAGVSFAAPVVPAAGVHARVVEDGVCTKHDVRTNCPHESKNKLT